MEISLAERTAIVTGGSSGIGATSARALAGAGAFVAVFDRKVEDGESIAGSMRAEGGAASFTSVDVTDEDSVRRAFRGRRGGARPDRRRPRQRGDHMDEGLARNLPRRLEQGDCHQPDRRLPRVPIGHGAHGRAAWRRLGHPHRLDQGLRHLARQCRLHVVEGRRDGAYPVVGDRGSSARRHTGRTPSCQGAIRTPMLEEEASLSARPAEEQLGQSALIHPLGRLGEAEDIAHAVVFLHLRRRLVHHRRGAAGRRRAHGCGAGQGRHLAYSE